MSRFLRNQGWVAGLFALLIFLFVVTKLIQPGYGSGDFGSLARAVLPYAFGVAAQAVVADTQEVVIHGYRSGGTGYLTPNIAPANITVATSCTLNAGGQTMQGGIYGARANGGQIVTVSASVPYRFMIGDSSSIGLL